MPPKTKSRSAMWFFAKEAMDQKRINVASVKDAIEAIYPEWKAMPAYEKAPYERLYEDWRTEIKLEKNLKPVVNYKVDYATYMSDNMPKDERSIELEEFFRRISSIKRENGVDGDSLSGIKNQCWYFCKFQTFCQSQINPDKESYEYNPYFVLAEVALIEYSIQNGITNQYQAFIKPNKIPLGYTSQCMDTSKEGHQIPLYSFDQVKLTYGEIFADIKNFLRAKVENNYYVPIFSMAKDVEETKFGLKYLYNNSMLTNEAFALKNVHELENLVVNLAKHCGTEYSSSSAYDLLTSYTFDYMPDSRCSYHEEGGIVHCSLGFVKKYSYLISDNLCQYYDVELSSKHMPIQKNVGTIIMNDEFSVRAQSSSFRSSNNSLHSGRGYNPVKRVNSYEDDRKNYYIDETDEENNPKAATSRNMPCTDIRKSNRQLVSDKFEKAATMSTVSSSVKTETFSRYEAYHNATGNRRQMNDDVVSINSDSISSSIASAPQFASNQNRYGDADEDDEDAKSQDGWTTVDKKQQKIRRVNNLENMDTKSEVSGSTMTNDTGSLKSSQKSSIFMGRGKAFRKN